MHGSEVYSEHAGLTMHVKQWTCWAHHACAAVDMLGSPCMCSSGQFKCTNALPPSKETKNYAQDEGIVYDFIPPTIV